MPATTEQKDYFCVFMMVASTLFSVGYNQHSGSAQTCWNGYATSYLEPSLKSEKTKQARIPSVNQIPYLFSSSARFSFHILFLQERARWTLGQLTRTE